ncbi:hypothetical protein DL766_008983 [Monosporascus sp. MC13-8B]|uniref:Acyl-CoA oxidase C-terminal domain-containing protein n=1 Tax=Monosporascus cannonballus TaxID=155416 RepID=A0ABY0HMU3_9PEZI|nr:hypothetical protein DL762_000722 [Monosporascus cannonballus]RYO98009.1 hypothetical protein DL763_002514 [Monosporascus cannonballus]RYP17073.1 hypothetical protein DL766_008983 [Monosporascus sp. MC13-8B]
MASKRDASLSQPEMMAEAQSRASFDVEALTRVIYGDADTVRRRREAWARVEAVLGTLDTSRLPRRYAKTSREDLYIDGLRMGKAAWDDRAKSGHDFFDWMTPRLPLFNNSPFGLSTSMFIKMLELMASPEQKSRWLVPATKGQINGAYMQTELSHSTSVRGLETTATFNESRDGFLLNTPTLSKTEPTRGGSNVYEEASYGTTLVARSKMARVTSIQLAEAVIIAIQFSTVRKRGNFTHGEDAPGTGVAIIQYKSQDYRLLTTLAKAYLMKWTRGFGGRPSTAELPDDLTCLISPFTEKCSNACLIDSTNSNTRLLIFRHRAQHLIGKADSRLVQGLKIGETKAQVWSQHIVLLTSAARAHVEYLVLRDFVEATERVKDVAVGKVLCKLRSVFALSTITNPQSTDALSFVEEGFLSGIQLDTIRDAINSLLDDLLPEAIGLTDSWDLTDAALSSAIGMKDGNAYETLMKWTEQLAINVAGRKDGGRHADTWGGYIRPAWTTSKL